MLGYFTFSILTGFTRLLTSCPPPCSPLQLCLGSFNTFGGLIFFPLSGTGRFPRFHYQDAGCHCCPEQGSQGMNISSPWTGKLSKERSNSDKLFGKLLNLYHFLLPYTHVVVQAHKRPHKRQSTGNIPAASLQGQLKNMD